MVDSMRRGVELKQKPTCTFGKIDGTKLKGETIAKLTQTSHGWTKNKSPGMDVKTG